MVLGLPLFLATVLGLGVLLVLPIWGILFCFFGEWIPGLSFLVSWLAAVYLVNYFIRQTGYHPLDRYHHGTI